MLHRRLVDRPGLEGEAKNVAGRRRPGGSGPHRRNRCFGGKPLVPQPRVPKTQVHVAARRPAELKPIRVPFDAHSVTLSIMS
jgi:hypothetical protein